MILSKIYHIVHNLRKPIKKINFSTAYNSILIILRIILIHVHVKLKKNYIIYIYVYFYYVFFVEQMIFSSNYHNGLL